MACAVVSVLAEEVIVVVSVKPNGELARRLRSIGLARVVDSRRVRTMLGIPIRDPHRQLASHKEVTGPLLSVIVPAYDVEEYLANCVGTILSQTYRSLEVIIVDDGSPDSCGDIADEIALRDKRVRVIHQENKGLGAARNTGLRYVNGKYLTFVDSDDQLLPDAYEKMIASLEASGSDFAIGAIERFDSRRKWQPRWVEEVFREAREGIRAEEHPAILMDLVVWNKVYRRDSWDRYAGFFPEGVLYEDQQCTVGFYANGATFDLLSDVIYRWRLRDNETSITQNKADLQNLRDRFDVAATVKGVLDRTDSRALTEFWYTKLLGEDLFWYYKEVPRASSEFWEVLKQGAEHYFSAAPAKSIQEISFARRVMLLSIVRGTYEDFLKTLLYFQERGERWRTQNREGTASLGWVPVLDDLSYGLTDDERVVDPSRYDSRAVITGQRLLPNGDVVISGYAYVQNLEGSDCDRLEATLSFSRKVDLDSGEALAEAKEYTLPIRRTENRFADIASADSVNRHSNSGFELTLPASLLDEIGEGIVSGESERGVVRLSLISGDRSWHTQRITTQINSSAGFLRAGEMSSNGRRFRVFRGGNQLRVSVRSQVLSATTASITGNRVHIGIKTFPEQASKLSDLLSSPLKLEVRKQGQVLARSMLHGEVENGWETTVLLPERIAAGKQRRSALEMVVVTSDHKSIGIAASASTERQLSTASFGLAVSQAGFLVAEHYVSFGTLEVVTFSADQRRVIIEGVCRFDRLHVRQQTPSFALVAGHGNIYPSKLEYQSHSGRYRAEFTLVRETLDGQEVFVPTGEYVLQMLLPTTESMSPSYWLKPSTLLLSKLPLSVTGTYARIELVRKDPRNGVAISVNPLLHQSDRGPRSQAQLAYNNFGLIGKRPLQEAVLFESFFGRSVADSPKAIDAALRVVRPDLPRYWSVRDSSVPAPEGAIPLTMYSRQWFEVLGSARYLVNNNNFPFFFRKKDGQRYLQTWHGTPLKKIGNDVPPASLSLSYRALMKREAGEYWDLLLAQTPWASKVLSSAFGYEGSVFSAGYPRNDALLKPSSVERRSEVRAFLGLSESQQVILYAPTWRDNVRAPNGKYLQPNYLNAQELQRKFGLDVIVLIRAHVNTAATHKLFTGRNVVDVSTYPDINDLYLAADLLVTDYSSVQFDFVNTGKPILYLTPDLPEYRDVVRGFYFDFERMTPGPIHQSTGEIVDSMLELNAVQALYQDAYAAFSEKFAGEDDGDASLRVVEEFFKLDLS